MRPSARARRFLEVDQAERARSSWARVHLVELCATCGAALGAGLGNLAEAEATARVVWLLAGAVVGLCVGWLVQRA